MRHHRARPLHVLALAPVAAIVAGALGPTTHALAAPTKPPLPIVITVDPGFGGQPTPVHPTIPFDPGAIGTNGLLEKDVDLDVGLRLAALLRAELVDVVMTRGTDVYVSAARRERISTAHRAALVVSIEADSSKNPKTEGYRVLYPSSASASFARTVSDALAGQIATYGITDAGVALGDAAWARNPVPAAAVDMGYLSNRTDAALLATPSVRQDVASGVRDGIEAYMPAIVARRDAIRAWRSGHAGGVTTGSLSPTAAAIPGASGFQFGPVIAWLAGITVVGLVLLFRETVARVLVVLIALVVRLLGGVMWLQRAAIRRRRRRQRMHPRAPADITAERPRAHAPAERTSRRTGSVYDDIPL